MTLIGIAAAAPPFGRLLAFARAAAQKIGQIARAYRHRSEAAVLAQFNDRMLRDIGLTRSDLRDAFAEPFWQNPTELLRGRARERQRRGCRAQ